MGDEVIVEFTNRDWAQPKVIGFLNNPRECCTVLADFKQLDPLNTAVDDLTSYYLNYIPVAHCDDEITIREAIYLSGGAVYTIPKEIPTLAANVPKDQWYLLIEHSLTSIEAMCLLMMFEVLAPAGHRALGMTFTLRVVIDVYAVEDGVLADNVFKFYSAPQNVVLAPYLVHEETMNDIGQYTIEVDFTFLGRAIIRYACQCLKFTCKIASIMKKT